MAAVSEVFGDLLEPGLRKIFVDTYKLKPQMMDMLYNVQKSNDSYEKDSSVGSFGTVPEFEGTVSYDDIYQGLKFVVVPVKFGYMLGNSKTPFTDKVTIKEDEQWTISRKDFFGGSLDFSTEKVG